jgi:hypothetical protein
MENLSSTDKAALSWAAKRADEWYGNVTGDADKERHHKQMMARVDAALARLGVRTPRRRAQ